MSGTDIISSPPAGARQLIFTDEIQALLEPEVRVIDNMTRTVITGIGRLFSASVVVAKRTLIWLRRIALIVGAISLLVLFVASMMAPKTGPALRGCSIETSVSFW